MQAYRVRNIKAKILSFFFFAGKNIFEESAEGVPRREVGKIEVKFTPRVFPTAARESQNPLEEEASLIIPPANKVWGGGGGI